MPERYDWDTIKTEYITGDISLKDISKKYGIRFRTVADRSRKEGWVNAKKKHKAKVTALATNKVATKQANQLAREIESCDMLSKALNETLKDVEQFNKHIVQNEYVVESGDTVRVTEEVKFGVVDARRMKEIAQTLKLVEEMKRSLLNIQKMEQLNRDNRENRRLQIEEERLEMQKQQADYSKPDKDIKVVITGYEEGWAD